jgi:hypothetical protein
LAREGEDLLEDPIGGRHEEGYSARLSGFRIFYEAGPHAGRNVDEFLLGFIIKKPSQGRIYARIPLARRILCDASTSVRSL